MEIKTDNRNELFRRNEISFVLEAEKTPSFEEMKKKIAKQLKKPEENIEVQNIKGKFGLKKFNVNACIYDSKEDLLKSEQKKKQKKESAKKEEPGEAESEEAKE